jgi:hypothetical protein
MNLRISTVGKLLSAVVLLAALEAEAGPVVVNQQPQAAQVQTKVTAAAIKAQISLAAEPVAAGCRGAQTASAAYGACKNNCATVAQNTPITPAELAQCANMSAENCAAQISSRRAQICMNSPAPTGCKDAFFKLQQENVECKNCVELKTATEQAIEAQRQQAKVVAQAEAALAQARAQLSAAEAKASALAARTSKACYDAQQ